MAIIYYIEVMTKKELISRISGDINLTTSDVQIVVDSALQEILNALEHGERIELRGFGTFKIMTTKPRKGRNIQTGELVDIPERKKVKFTVSSCSSLHHSSR